MANSDNIKLLKINCFAASMKKVSGNIWMSLDVDGRSQ
jgi:hypothetical protein